MAHIKIEVRQFGASNLPRDASVNVLHFNQKSVNITTFGGGQTDLDGVCNDMASIYVVGWFGGAARHIEVRAYDMADASPRRPKGIHIRNPTGALEKDVPHELALCLSFYAGTNAPNRRGRIYLPVYLSGAGMTTPGARPDSAYRDVATQLVTTSNRSFPDLGGTDFEWSVYSPTNNALYAVTNAYCDDEWDVQRRRGLRAVNRTSVVRAG